VKHNKSKSNCNTVWSSSCCQCVL